MHVHVRLANVTPQASFCKLEKYHNNEFPKQKVEKNTHTITSCTQKNIDKRCLGMKFEWMTQYA